MRWGIPVGVIFVFVGLTCGQDPKPPELTAEEKKLAAEAEARTRASASEFKKENFSESAAQLNQALEIRRRLYPTSKFPNGHPEIAKTLHNLGLVTLEMDRTQEALTLFRQSLEMFQKVFPLSKHPNGHPEIAMVLNRLGDLFQKLGQTEPALKHFRQSLEMLEKLLPTSKYPDGHPNLAISFNNVGRVLKEMGHLDDALPYYQRNLEMMRKLYPATKYPNGHPFVATALNNLAMAKAAMGHFEQALALHRQSLEMSRALSSREEHPDGKSDVVVSLNNVGLCLQEMGQFESALTYFRECLEMAQKLALVQNSTAKQLRLATCLNNMGLVLCAMGQHSQALPHYQRSLEIHRTIFTREAFPNGHPALADSFNNMGDVLLSLGRNEQAISNYSQSFEQYQKLYPPSRFPKGHPSIAISSNNLSDALRSVGKSVESLAYAKLGLQISQELFPASKYPNGHPDLANSLHNVGTVLRETNEPVQALSFFSQSLEIYKKLFPKSQYPDGHPNLVTSLKGLGITLQLASQSHGALPLIRESLKMHVQLLARESTAASEDASGDKFSELPAIRDRFLSIAQSTNLTARVAFDDLWPSRSMLGRLLEQRQANIRAAGTEVGDKLDELRGNRRRTDQLLQDTKVDRAYRDAQLAKLADRRDVLERELVAAIPTLKRWQELDKLGPADLAKALPANAVFIDVIRYTHFEYVDKKQKRTPSYVAFVVGKATLTPDPSPAKPGEGSSVVRVELGDAVSIESAITTWRTAIDQRKDTRGVGAGEVAPKDGDPAKASELLSKRVWEPIAKHLPQGTKTLYLALDGDLARMPWAALPVAKNRVLLEDFEIAVVPHGVFLLDHLRSPRKADGQSLFALGGVDYGSSVWPKLPGTESEMSAISSLAPGERETASLGEASVEKVSKGLAKARYAHIATHGFFDADGFANEKKREEIAFKNRQLGDETRRVASKNPLGYVGLVLADGKVMSGLTIVDLHLENLKLVTLSACETGLGEYTGAKGVENLQMAFHVAGAQNVVASLWKVSDAATAALMAKFYHELWKNSKSPLAALREAQLFIYYHPELIPDAIGERGAPKAKEALAVKTTGTSFVGRKDRADTKLWAGFVLSGVGK